MKTDLARRMKDLKKENQRLRRAILDLTLDKLILQEAGNPLRSLPNRLLLRHRPRRNRHLLVLISES